MIATAEDFATLLRRLSGLDVSLSRDIEDAVEELLAEVGSVRCVRRDIASRFYGRINEKLGANKEALTRLYGVAATAGVTFNYPQKRAIRRAVDESDLNALRGAIQAGGAPESLVDRLVAECQPVDGSTTQQLLRAETEKPSKLRKALQRDVEKDVLSAAAGSLVWALWPAEVLFTAFGGGGEAGGAREYMTYLERLHPELFNRDRTLSVRFANAIVGEQRSSQRQWLAEWMASEYEALANHGFIALIVDASSGGDAWHIINDATLFGERFRETHLRQMFFRKDEVRRATAAHISTLDADAAQFEILNEGFTYRDVFVLTDGAGRQSRLVLLMQKNARDETKIPCPACRGLNIEGNSYPILGVRSWECRNQLCPNRSIYNRGNRFQFRSSVQQAAIEDDRNTITFQSVNRWRRDILPFEGDAEIVDTLIRHYSIADDGVAVVDLPHSEVVESQFRKISSALPDPVAPPAFWGGSFFRRFLPALKPAPKGESSTPDPSLEFAVVEADSTTFLGRTSGDTFDRAITSPPYFNAREYSQWPNLYCYLFDMYANSVEVFRTLKPGAIYAYNIFDYFDNERVVTFSDMGRKRIPLGALMATVMEEAGFELIGVIPWDKGEIHGKRGFNGGNYSPYYQSPFNCWEHVLILRKPGDGKASASPIDIPEALLRATLRIAPVVKIVGGENVHGHTAPFPEDLPAALLAGLPKQSVVLDPYGGSGTTARAALRQQLRALIIERDPTYAALAVAMTRAVQELTESQLVFDFGN